MMKNFPNRYKLLYTDTERLVYEIISKDIYEEVIKPHLHKFDTSNYSSNNLYNIPLINKKVPDLMKDEAGGFLIKIFVGLPSKMYAICMSDEKCTKTTKGIINNIVKNAISFQDYVDCLQQFKEKFITQRTIQSYEHNLFSVEQNKVALTHMMIRDS